MALSIKHPEADRLARELSATTGESLTDAIINALKERLRRQRGQVTGRRLREDLRAIRRRCASLPVHDTRAADEIIGYDERGVPR
jgi:antitoxin VapB